MNSHSAFSDDHIMYIYLYDNAYIIFLPAFPPAIPPTATAEKATAWDGDVVLMDNNSHSFVTHIKFSVKS